MTTVEWFVEGEIGRVRGGGVADGPTYVGPLAGRTCVGYEITVQTGAPPTRLVLHPTAGQPLVLSTDPGDLND